MRCERGSVGVVLPASSRSTVKNGGTGMRIIGLDIHRAFAEAVAWKDGKLSRLGRGIMGGEALKEFAKQLSNSDIVVIEATGNAASVAAVIGPHVSRVVIANPKQVRLIAHAKIKTDKIDASVLAQLYASGFLPEVWIADAATQAAPPGDAAQPDRATALAAKEHHPVEPARPFHPVLHTAGSVRPVWSRSILCAREETRESRGMLELFLNTGRGLWVARRRKSAIFEGFRGTLRVKMPEKTRRSADPRRFCQ